jgi:hypothetical protein
MINVKCLVSKYSHRKDNNRNYQLGRVCIVIYSGVGQGKIFTWALLIKYVLRAFPSMFSMWPYKHVSHIQV